METFVLSLNADVSATNFVNAPHHYNGSRSAFPIIQKSGATWADRVLIPKRGTLFSQRRHRVLKRAKAEYIDGVKVAVQPLTALASRSIIAL